MTLSSDQFAGHGLDAMLIVYSLLDNHPASVACESFIRDHTSWFTTTLTWKSPTLTAENPSNRLYESVIDFEKNNVILPEDIAAMLTPPQT